MSDLQSAENIRIHESYRFTHVLSAMPGKVVLPTHPSRPLSLKTFQLPIQDNPFEELAAHLPGTTAFISDALRSQGRVLVHCMQGRSRSASVIAAYLMAANKGWTAEDAIRHIKAKCMTAEPNVGFMGQLREYYRALQQEQQ